MGALPVLLKFILILFRIHTHRCHNILKDFLEIDIECDQDTGSHTVHIPDHRQKQMLRACVRRVQPVRFLCTVLKNIFIARTLRRPAFHRSLCLRHDQLVHELIDLLLLNAVSRKDLACHSGILLPEPQQKMLRPDVGMLHLLCLFGRIFDGVLRLIRI